MNTPSPNSMKRDPGRGSAYLSFLKKRCRDFFFFCLLLGVYVAFITLTGIGCPIRFFTGISCPGCGMSRAVLLMLSGHFQAAFRMHPLVYAVLPAGDLALLRAGTDGVDFGVLKRGSDLRAAPVRSLASRRLLCLRLHCAVLGQRYPLAFAAYGTLSARIGARCSTNEFSS